VLMLRGSMSEHDALIVIIIVCTSLCIYFISTIIMVFRGTANGMAICLINLFLGWTVLGWFGCLFWAAFGNTTNQVKLRDAAYQKIAQ
jgi:hypothetical protein